MVVVDPSGHPMKFDGLTVLENVVATQNCRIEVDVPGPGGKGWKRTSSSVELQADESLNTTWREDISAGAAHILETTYVPANDAHYDNTWTKQANSLTVHKICMSSDHSYLSTGCESLAACPSVQNEGKNTKWALTTREWTNQYLKVAFRSFIFDHSQVWHRLCVC